MAEQPTRWGKVEQPAGREIRLKRRHWAIGDLETRQGIAIVFGDDSSHACLIEAAPDLRAALQALEAEISSRFDNDDDMSPELRAMMIQARTALAKAEPSLLEVLANG